MRGLDRRVFLGLSVGGLSALAGPYAIAAVSDAACAAASAAAVDHASALNLATFLQNRDSLALTGLVALRPVEAEQRQYADGSLLLFPFKRDAVDASAPAFLPGRDAAVPLIATVAMTPGGLPPDEYFCNYVLKAPWNSFISFSIGTPFARGAEKRPWHSNVQIGGNTVGIGWTSSNLNHPWFAGSRWIPDRGEGGRWRAHIVDGLRRLSALSEAVG